MQYFISAYDEWAALDDLRDRLEEECQALNDLFACAHPSRRDAVRDLMEDVERQRAQADRDIDRLRDLADKEAEAEENEMRKDYYDAVVPWELRYGGKL